MGSWDSGIMDGDTPLDMLGCIEDVIGGKVTAERLNANMTTVLKIPGVLSKRWGGWDRQDRRIFSMVLGFKIVTSGAKLPARIKNRVLTACEVEIRECKADRLGWLHPRRRIAHVRELMRKVRAYKGKPLRIEQKSLIAKMAEKLGES